MTPQQQTRAEFLAHELLRTLYGSEPKVEPGLCEFCGKGPRGPGFRMDQYPFGERKAWVCSLCIGSLTQRMNREFQGDFVYKNGAYWRFRKSPFTEAPKLVLAEWAARRIVKFSQREIRREA